MSFISQTLSRNRSDCAGPVLRLNMDDQMVLLGFASTVTIRAQPGDKHRRKQSCSQEHNKRSAIRARPIKACTHYQRTESTCECKSSECGAVHFPEVEESKITAREVRDKIHFCAQAQTKQDCTCEYGGATPPPAE